MNDVIFFTLSPLNNKKIEDKSSWLTWFRHGKVT